MLILKRRIGENIKLSPELTITVLSAFEDQVVLGFRRFSDINKAENSERFSDPGIQNVSSN